MPDSETAKSSTFSNLAKVGSDRSLLAMLLLGLAAGLPYAVLVGTMNAWFTKTEVDVSTIGVLSLIGLAYSFKFIWSPALHRSKAPIIGGMGNRRSWMLLFQFVIMISIGFLAVSDPVSQLPTIAVIALCGVVASASQDIVIDAWRIEIARDDTHLNVLSGLYQLGYRVAGFIGGFLALLLADRFGWEITFGFLALMMLLGFFGVALAREPEVAQNDQDTSISLGRNVQSQTRYMALGVVLIGWVWSLFMLGDFLSDTLLSETPPNARDFIRGTGPWIVFATVISPAIIAAWLNWKNRAADSVYIAPSSTIGRTADTLHRFILEPMMDIIGRLGWAAPLILLLILSYRFTDLVWGSLAYVFYLGVNYGAMGYTLAEVGVASKFVGVIMTIVGVGFGGLAIKQFGRMPCLIAGAVLAAATNMLFWDLTTGARFVDGFLSFTHLYGFMAFFGVGERLAWLVAAIAGENIAVGFASVVFVAYLSSIVNPKYAAVQYALLASLTMLVGTLGRAALGEMIETQGFAYVFILTTLLGLIAVAASIAEAVRTRIANKPGTESKPAET
ncbi:MAG: hypothetical protein P8J78_00055 [Maricaulis sp.]|nr:hypothetical protein [Maricaulis sp.]